MRRHADDARIKRANLTAKGRAEVRIYDALSDALADRLLAALGEAQRSRLMKAMAEVERLMREAAIDVRVEAPDSADARWCLDGYFAELAQRFETGFDPARSNPAHDAEMVPPAGFFVVARLDGRPVGCGALKRKSETMGEIKRMWTAPSARGQGVARRVLRALEAKAREAGLKTLRLETNRTLEAALSLYRNEGFREVDPFNDEPYAHHWFEKP